jgi:hypothetical protein
METDSLTTVKGADFSAIAASIDAEASLKETLREVTLANISSMRSEGIAACQVPGVSRKGRILCLERNPRRQGAPASALPLSRNLNLTLRSCRHCGQG